MFFRNFTLYELVNEETGAVVTGRKQAFCLMDITQKDGSAGPAQYMQQSGHLQGMVSFEVGLGIWHLCLPPPKV